MIDCVIFDCDGVLVDSERVFGQVVAEFAADQGLSLSIETAITRFKGGKLADMMADLEADLKRPLPPDSETRIRAAMTTKFEAELSPIAGIETVLDHLELPYCVASNGPPEKMAVTLGVTGLLPRFTNRIFSAYQVGKWKPDPTLYLHAAKMMGVAPNRCAVVEDSVTGVRAGRAAGMTVFGYADLTDAADLAKAGATVFQPMEQLPALLNIKPDL